MGNKKNNWWCSLKILRIVSIALRRANYFQLAQKPQIRFASRGFAPWTPKGVLPQYPAGGIGRPQTPRLLGAAYSL